MLYCPRVIKKATSSKDDVSGREFAGGLFLEQPGKGCLARADVLREYCGCV